ncbi:MULTISPECIES: zinc piracy TonB-dependent receptor ZnuD [unclassified Acinetobacter]|uniref:zinc piracy TonB-dependent receptor ZnuD n=1 Tax=unclassified Acinetobacter TaxID=196816 RepID=UPI0024495AB7|nr:MULTISPECIES: zinc piracy TonB-dependent receptor ZnuD [unclassified Acinetobacter]MDH0031600.1 zinc piracy TonB-dependent receptor ZnuD [Acinetobacter sp. GD04021]MDH0887239.1 zinc piracy TonB-dependent receptor ZnuD [Acinetobacter sp. GD03873]MDH1083690.1 zinc piracy TonB-dependent receptor ZnuD [Acinetobacter sp. GD03983]MDH2190566.1 zinc piracy TonB-dependent receptor ZnuD [Acinetobacter sp. GD03645]MDH2204217.1 zinc piracy TonB-dependent receptor ZnuD [Acinetobacter sp. GD03647]
MSFPKNILTLSILAVASVSVFAAENEQATTLDTIRIKAHPLEQTSKDFAVADTVVDEKRLAQGAVTIGEALSGETGISSNQFGAGSSRPVIRGQDGPRVKILQNSSENIDVSTLSPDHAVTVDPALAKQVEVIRGPSTLLFGAGTVGGLVNVTDSKLPTAMPEKGYEGNVGLRYNTGSDEKLASAGVTVGLGDQVALRVEGLKREANDYIAPDYVHEGEKERRVDNTFAKGQTVNVGLSWIYDRGFTGISYSNRQDQYGLPGHSHEYESCHLHGLSLHCGEHDHDEEGHDHEDHDHDHAHEAGPWIDLKSERYDVRTELDDPFAGFKKLRAQASYTDYQHDEIEEDTIATRFKNKGYDGRLELVHNPLGAWEGVIGTQYGQQKLELTGEEAFLAPNTTKKWSIFALEHAQFNDVHVELAARADQQKIDIDDSSKKDFDGSAFSVSGAANWEFAPNYKLSLVTSHQERLPLAQELYADGGHFATNTYELGNDQLSKEKSNNVELGFHYDDQTFDYHVHVYHNWFDDYIYAQTLDRYKDFRLVQYAQDKAKFYGAEAEAGYQISPVYKLSVFGDYVRGKIDNDNAPRVPAGRLGTKVNANFDDHWSGSAEYYHVFQQDKIAAYETDTQSYNMLNLGVAYSGKYSNVSDYRVFLNANNLLDDQVYQHASFLSTIPQVGRNFTVGVNFSF